MPLRDRVLVCPVDESTEKTPHGIILPETTKKESKEGIVVAVGTGKVTEDGTVIPMVVKKGDKVIFRQGWDNEVDVDDEKHFLIPESEILAIIKEK